MVASEGDSLWVVDRTTRHLGLALGDMVVERKDGTTLSITNIE